RQAPARRQRSARTKKNRTRDFARGGNTMANDGIGARVLRKEDKRFITARGRYTDDIHLWDMTYAAFVLSPHAHARIKSIDTKDAAAMPGVQMILTGADLAADKIGDLI